MRRGYRRAFGFPKREAARSSRAWRRSGFDKTNNPKGFSAFGCAKLRPGGGRGLRRLPRRYIPRPQSLRSTLDRPATSAASFCREPEPLAEVLRELFASCRLCSESSFAERLKPLVSCREVSIRSASVTRSFCPRCVNPQPSRLSRLHRKCRSRAAPRRPQPTFPKFGPRCRNRPRTDRQGKRSSDRAISCGFGISRS